jgi:hypothetical protein
LKPESIYRSYGKAVRDKEHPSFTILGQSVIDMISSLTADQVKEMYMDFGIRYLKKEVRAWDKIGKYHISEIISKIIEERNNGSWDNQ